MLCSLLRVLISKVLEQSLQMLDKTKKDLLLPQLRQAKTYWKTRFRLHCEDDISCASHCLQYSLPHPTDKTLVSNCSKLHNESCWECNCIVTTIEQIEHQIDLLPDSHSKGFLTQDTKITKNKFNIVAETYFTWCKTRTSKRNSIFETSSYRSIMDSGFCPKNQSFQSIIYHKKFL